MSAFPEYEAYDGLGLAELVRRGEVHPGELVDAAAERMDRHESALNAVVHRMVDRARAAAERPLPDGPFTGVPFLLKDLMTLCAGEPMTAGSRFLSGWVPAHDANLVRRYRDAGLLIVGKTNVPEFGASFTTEPELHGPARNPWDLARTPGGSSGGSAAAVAAGYTPLAHGNDGGGSIRVPAAFCGLFGLKPTRARTPLGPDYGDAWFGLTVEHAITRSVRDSAALLDATRGPDAGAPYRAPPPARPYREELERPPGRLRIAVHTGALLGASLEPEGRAAVADAARLCAELGHEVEEAAPEVGGGAARAFLTLVAAGTAQEIALAARAVGREPEREAFEQTTWLLRLIGRRLRAETLASAIYEAHALGRRVAPFFERHDVLLCATAAGAPPPLGSLDPADLERLALGAVRRLPVRALLDRVLDELGSRVLESFPNTAPFNMTGQPAMSVPLFWTEEGLPVGVQAVGRFGDEATLFRLAAQLEEARPWAGRRPASPRSAGEDASAPPG